MWQNKFESPLDLELTPPSRYLLYYLIVLHGLAIVALLMPMHLPDAVRGLLLLAVTAGLLWQIYRYRCQWRITSRLIWRTDGSWDYWSGERRMEEMQLLPSSYVTSWLIILHFRKPGTSRVTVVLLPDSLPKEQWHRLWIRLRYSEKNSL